MQEKRRKTILQEAQRAAHQDDAKKAGEGHEVERRGGELFLLFSPLSPSLPPSLHTFRVFLLFPTPLDPLGAGGDSKSHSWAFYFECDCCVTTRFFFFLVLFFFVSVRSLIPPSSVISPPFVHFVFPRYGIRQRSLLLCAGIVLRIFFFLLRHDQAVRVMSTQAGDISFVAQPTLSFIVLSLGT